MIERPTDESNMKDDFLDALKTKPLKQRGKKNKKHRQDWQNDILERIEAFLKCEDFDVNFCGDEISHSPLWQATMRPETFDKILERKTTDANLFDLKGRTAIFLAVESQELQKIKLLKKAGALIEWRDSEGWTPLSRAVELGHLETVRFLVEQENAKINPDDGLDPTPLQRAVSIGSTNIVQYLLANAANVNHRDAYGRTPLSMAVSLGPSKEKKDIIGLLIERDADLDLADYEENTPLISAVLQSDIESVKQLLESKHPTVNVNQYARGRTALFFAVEQTSIEILEMLIPKAEVNLKDMSVLEQTPLAWAADIGKYWAIKKLLEDRRTEVDLPNAHGRTPFSLAAGKSRVAIMQLLLDHHAKPHELDGNQHTGFWWLLKARSDHGPGMPISIIRQTPTAPRNDLAKLLDSLPLPNEGDKLGRSWLSWAAQFGDSQIVECFLANKEVDPNQADTTEGTFARTPVIWAAEKNHQNVVRLMIAMREDDFSLNYLIRHSKAYEEEFGAEQLLHTFKNLISWGSAGNEWFVERRDYEGNKPLHLACFQQSEKLVEVLIGEIPERSFLNSKDRTGRIPLQYALQKRHETIVRRLLNSMSKLECVRSSDWFELGNMDTHWVQINQEALGGGFDWKLILKPECDLLPREKRRTLFLCAQPDVWSRVPRQFDAEHDMKFEMGKSEYVQYIRKSFRSFEITYVSIAFPAKDQNLSENYEQFLHPCGIAWVRKLDTKEKVNIFLSSFSGSTLPDGCIPSSEFEIFELFLKHLKSKWDDVCSVAGAEIDEMRAKQVKQKGQASEFIDGLAKNTSIRMEVRKCLRSHVGRLRCEVEMDYHLEEKDQRKLVNLIGVIEISAVKILDDMEQAVRELLQMELAWVSKNEAASIKRLSWITFIFLPLMFASSLFGMNVNLLKDNPDWRWYIPSGAVSLLLTGGLWILSRFVPRWSEIWSKLWQRKRDQSLLIV